MAFRTSRERFEQLVEQALEALPRKFKKHLTNITIIVEDYPTQENTRNIGAGQGYLLGLFRGVAHPSRGGFFDIPHPLPDEIILFQKNIERICSTEKDLVEEIRKTLIHEIGHYFGFSEDELRRYE
ncbi:MAG: metallopeptidase family protein [Nitrospirae bacterium]|nr:metallopeptidase family protein [Nitrospirota bacterium]MCL5236966.1 metallopeptidase family protein [Nitrospirota bacterium]